MTKSLYIASGLKNYQGVLALQDWLFSIYGVTVTFDWASEYGRQVSEGIILTDEQKANLAARMEQGVVTADALLLMMPAKRGAHVEFGIARGLGKPIAVFCENPEDEISFYRLPGVKIYRDRYEAAEMLLELI